MRVVLVGSDCEENLGLAMIQLTVAARTSGGIAVATYRAPIERRNTETP